jgi:hypothetical protein
MLVKYLTKLFNGGLSISGTLSFLSTLTHVSPNLPRSCFQGTKHNFSQGQAKSVMEEWDKEYLLGTSWWGN